jgi:hypothetical protein
VINGCIDNFDESLGAATMAFESRQAALRSPTSITIHDNTHVNR